MSRRAASGVAWPQDQGCFGTMRAYGGRVLALEEHLERLWASARVLALPVAPTPAGVRRAALEALAAAGGGDRLVRVQLVSSAGGVQIRVVVTPFHPCPAAWSRDGVAAVTVPTRKPPVSAIDYQSKASARLGSVLAVLEATQQGGFEGLMLGREGWVTETTISNVLMLRQGGLLTPPCRLGLLAGITRQLVRRAAGRMGLRVQDAPLSRHDLYNADEVLLAGTTKELLPVVRIDGRAIGAGRPGPRGRRLQALLRQVIQEALAHESPARRGLTAGNRRHGTGHQGAHQRLR